MNELGPSPADDNGASGGEAWKHAAIGHLFWYASRTLFALTILFIAYMIKEPLDNLIMRMQLSDTKRVMFDESIERVREMDQIYSKAQSAFGRLLDLCTFIRTSSLSPDRLRDEFALMEANAQSASDSYNSSLHNRKHFMDLEINAVFAALSDGIRAGIRAAGQAYEEQSKGTGDQHPTFKARLLHATKLLRRIENFLVIERTALVSPTKG